MTDNRAKRFLISGVTAVLTFWLTGCSDEQHYALFPQETAGAVSGEVSIREDNLGDTALNIEVDNLPPPQSETSPKYYVAWGESGDDAVRLGLLNREAQRGKLIATTDLNRFAVTVTAENFPDASEPSGPVVLKSATLTVEQHE